MGVSLQPVPPNHPTPRHRREPRAPHAKGISILKTSLALLFLGFCGAAGTVIYKETQTSFYQAREISRYASRLTYQVEPGKSDAIRFPAHGPFDERLGYAKLPQLLDRAQNRGFEIVSQARFSPELMRYTELGLFPPYNEKLQAGLEAYDCRGDAMYHFRYPRRGYENFTTIPNLIVQSLLFIENRSLLDESQPFLNPAVDWGRFAKASAFQVAKAVGIPYQSMGGSTLATQMEKYRHSPDGVTSSAEEKLKQMASASVRAYHNGPETLGTRRELVLSYLNTVPLSAAPGYGEVNGLGDGLYVWFGANFDTVNRLLSSTEVSPEELDAQAIALRQVIALMIAHRRPSYYLARGRAQLASLTDSYIRIMAKQGAIPWALRNAALKQQLSYRDFRVDPAVAPMVTNKGINVVRNRLNGLLGVPLYDLDRLDLKTSTSLQRNAQEEISEYLKNLNDEDFAKKVGLLGERLLSAGQADDVNYSFTLFERTRDGNLVRIQTDNTDQPFDINEGSKLELGSTAKLRVLTTYLEVMAELHQQYNGELAASLQKTRASVPDILSQWVIDYLLTAEDKSLRGILNAAMERTYSANPGERFFTGGGVHTFNNFKREDNGRVPTVRESLQESINLPFVRMLRDLVKHSVAKKLGSNTELLSNDKDPRRKEYLARFADREGLVYLNRFWRKYKGKESIDQLDAFLDGLRQTSPRLAAVHRYLFPEADLATFGKFLRERLPNEKLSEKTIGQLYERYGPGKYNLTDQGYIARVHPLELWLLGYMQKNPKMNWNDAVEASADERQEVYGWLFRTRAKNARDSRIRTMLEVEAFLDIHQRWKRVGYPFDHLVPSYATALGSSGDRPAALAELMGIIVNDGVRLPTVRIHDLHFARETPYETALDRPKHHVGEQVLHPEVAATLRQALSEVVTQGTARRLVGAFNVSDGSALMMGGKTGTGDNRLVTVGAGGSRVGSRALNRTATFVFYLGANHFGTLTAFVPGREASAFRFTSALPVQALKGMAPLLLPYLEPAGSGFCGALTPPGTEVPDAAADGEAASETTPAGESSAPHDIATEATGGPTSDIVDVTPPPVAAPKVLVPISEATPNTVAPVPTTPTRPASANTPNATGTPRQPVLPTPYPGPVKPMTPPASTPSTGSAPAAVPPGTSTTPATPATRQPVLPTPFPGPVKPITPPAQGAVPAPAQRQPVLPTPYPGPVKPITAPANKNAPTAPAAPARKPVLPTPYPGPVKPTAPGNATTPMSQ